MSKGWKIYTCLILVVVCGRCLLTSALAQNAPLPSITLAGLQYEPVNASEYKISMQFSGPIRWDDKGTVNGGPIASLSFGDHGVELTDNMIKDGLVSTKNYGKLLMRNVGTGMTLYLTKDQQKQLKDLIK